MLLDWAWPNVNEQAGMTEESTVNIWIVPERY